METVVSLDGASFPIGYIWVVATDRGILRVRISRMSREEVIAELLSHQATLTVSSSGLVGQEFLEELDHYFSGRLTTFKALPLMQGTPFQEHIWTLMRTIPYGATRTYRELAIASGRPNAYRAVGNAAAANLLPILVPCHRVVAQHGLGGYSPGLLTKKWLLDHERTVAQRRKLREGDPVTRERDDLSMVQDRDRKDRAFQSNH